MRRAERFTLIVDLIRETQASVSRVLDLGCGAGSLTLRLLESFPEAEVIGVDFDPTMLALARERLAKFGPRSRLALTDLRDPSWVELVAEPADAVVSTTALHWLKDGQLARVYAEIAQILRPGGIFLNADHVASDHPPIQAAWERRRAEMRRVEADQDADDWHAFWSAYAEALQLDIAESHRRVIGGWEGGHEDGLPLAWHFDKLSASGFVSVDCFWRCDCDALYGGIRG